MSINPRDRFGPVGSAHVPWDVKAKRNVHDVPHRLRTIDIATKILSALVANSSDAEHDEQIALRAWNLATMLENCQDLEIKKEKERMRAEGYMIDFGRREYWMP